MWGWVADYPDPENFFFLLSSEMARSDGGPNTANFRNADYDALFRRMRAMENGPERLELIRRMRAIVETERPWIELFHAEMFVLQHGWMRNVKPLGMSFSILKYEDVDPVLRTRRRAEWNRPVLWPLYALAGLAVLLLVPAVVTFLRERQ
jgi:ABC-type oligopeptide transport system substrate-binding subunit